MSQDNFNLSEEIRGTFIDRDGSDYRELYVKDVKEFIERLRKWGYKK